VIRGEALFVAVLAYWPVIFVFVVLFRTLFICLLRWLHFGLFGLLFWGTIA
jgi:hypothetical protein